MITELIRTAAARASDRTAFITHDGSITYGELMKRADGYASLLKKQGNGPVVIYGDKSVNVFVMMLACLFARRAYVIAEPSLPEKRLMSIIKTSGASLLITEEPVAFPDITVCFPDDLINFKNEEPKEGGDVAYIAFTSGTTGEPKGVIITYGNLYNFVKWMTGIEPISGYESPAVFNHARFSFDLSAAAIFFSLCKGGTLVAFSADPKDGMFGAPALISRYGVKFAVMTPTFLRLCLLSGGFDRKNCPELECVYLCGETLRKSTALRLFSAFPDVSLINAYGPSECTSAVSYAFITEKTAETGVIPVGTVGKCACSVDVRDGRIVVSGESVAAGYKNGACFNGEYDTGDLGHIKDGFIYFDGRSDRQIKYKGYRIELDGIEARISEIDRVCLCAVKAKYTDEGEVKHTVAYVYGEGDGLEEYVRSALRETLPEYMIPKIIKRLENPPPDNGGKLDLRNAK